MKRTQSQAEAAEGWLTRPDCIPSHHRSTAIDRSVEDVDDVRHTSCTSGCIDCSKIWIFSTFAKGINGKDLRGHKKVLHILA